MLVHLLTDCSCCCSYFASYSSKMLCTQTIMYNISADYNEKLSTKNLDRYNFIKKDRTTISSVSWFLSVKPLLCQSSPCFLFSFFFENNSTSCKRGNGKNSNARRNIKKLPFFLHAVSLRLDILSNFESQVTKIRETLQTKFIP